MSSYILFMDHLDRLGEARTFSSFCVKRNKTVYQYCSQDVFLPNFFSFSKNYKSLDFYSLIHLFKVSMTTQRSICACEFSRLSTETPWRLEIQYSFRRVH